MQGEDKSVVDMSVEEFRDMLAQRREALFNVRAIPLNRHAPGGRRQGAFGGVFEYKAKKNMRRKYTK
jgi:hypothetical protein